jgi:hypothetical protein
MTEPSAIGNVAGLEAGQVLLPSFIGRHESGLYVNLLVVDSRDFVVQFVERVFGAGARFAGLDYDLFLKLLFLWKPADIDRQLDELKHRGKPPEVFLAKDIVPFPQERRDIYKSVKVLDGGKTAEYMFQPVSVEREIDDADAPDGSGRRTVSERLYPDFDEFVAALWEKGVRFGIDAKLVREAIARDKAERLAVAQFKPHTAGKDASVDEQTDLLHRDDAPRIGPDGRMDLCHYRNRFPQVAAGTRLFKKLPRVDGIPGWDVQGRELAPPPVKDFDVETLAGPGTQVARENGAEYVVAAMDGFIDIDARSGKVSVIDKIVGREGVSLRTTGNLSLAGEYEEHGEVQEKRVVEGRNMTFFADVFGNIVSDGGRVTLKRTVSGGSVRNFGGTIAIEGSASRATLEARGGEVVAAAAEGSTIIATKVSVERAVRCDIVADEVVIGVSEGCAIAAKKVTVKNSTVRRDEATMITMILPDSAPFERQLNAIAETRAEAQAEIDKHGATLNELAGLPDMKSYLAIQPKLKAKTLTMTPAQQVQWQALLARLAPVLRQFAALNGEIREARATIEEGERERERVLQARAAELNCVSCAIEKVSGDTQVRTLRQTFEATPLSNLPAKELYKRLTEPGEGNARLFVGSSGSFSWQPSADDGEA